MSARQARLWKPILAAALAVMAVASLGAAITDLGHWYQSLRQPAWKPPDWLFGPAWTLIFGLTAVAGIQAWLHIPKGFRRKRMLWLFALNAFLNILWSVLFFRMHRPDWALVEVGFLWLSILALVIVVWPYSRKASALLLPYLVWVSYAATLNLSVVRLNAPF